MYSICIIHTKAELVYQLTVTGRQLVHWMVGLLYAAHTRSQKKEKNNNNKTQLNESIQYTILYRFLQYIYRVSATDVFFLFCVAPILVWRVRVAKRNMYAPLLHQTHEFNDRQTHTHKLLRMHLIIAPKMILVVYVFFHFFAQFQ